MKAKKIVLLIALGVLLAGFLLWAVGAALGAKTLYLQNGELTSRWAAFPSARM